MPGVFISYRREDAAGEASHLYDDLTRHFGADMVFRDIYSLEPGVEYDEAIRRWIGGCDALIVLIGRQWLALVGKDGRRRLDDPADLHRREIEAALSRGVRVIPALVQDASMPTPSELPDGLSKLAARHGFRLTDERWQTDAGVLIDRLANALGRDVSNGGVGHTPSQPEPARRPGANGTSKPPPAATAPAAKNTSGMGREAILPDELRGWNWGAFLMNWIWGIGNGTWIALLCLVPYAGLVMPFVLGAKGNEWAWRNKRWDDIEHFRRVQKRWAQWGVGLLLIGFVFLFILIASSGR